MKSPFLLSLLIVIVLLAASCTTEKVVAVRPDVPVVVERPAPPPGERIYVDYEYKWRKGKYEAVPGYYIKKRSGKTWIPGKWEQKPNGFVWIPGHWK